MAKEIASWVVQIITGIDFLECLQADRSQGDRESIEGYDVHWVLKGADKSPSVKCLGVDSNSQGTRADLIIADDLESSKNSRTVMGRELLEDLSKEFESICSNGDIVYLGTPQTSESIYNNLPSRGYGLRIWTGRYPSTDEELAEYSGNLAPMLVADMEKDPSLKTGYGLGGAQGAPTCPEMLDDTTLIEKEESMGTAKFKLQFMLSTALSDAERYPLKPSNLIVADFTGDLAPCLPVWSQDPNNLFKGNHIRGAKPTDRLYWAVKREYDYAPTVESFMYIDPAGGGLGDGDETVGVIVKRLHSYLYISEIIPVKGGYLEEDLLKLVEAAKRHRVKTVCIEKNYGNGAHKAMLEPLFQKNYPCLIEEVWESGQKELRIIDVLEPVMARHQLVIAPSVLEQDYKTIQRYPVEKQKTYSLLFQMSMITRDKKCLRHDDRLDALAGAVRHFIERIGFDTESRLIKQKEKESKSFMNAWVKRSRVPLPNVPKNKGGLASRVRKRRK